MKRTKIGGEYVLMLLKHPRSGYPVNIELVKAIPINELETAKEKYNEWVREYQDPINSVVLAQRHCQMFRSGNVVQVEYNAILKPYGDTYSRYWTVFDVGWQRVNGEDILLVRDGYNVEFRKIR